MKIESILLRAWVHQKHKFESVFPSWAFLSSVVFHITAKHIELYRQFIILVT